ncbi:MAG: hypothetical protein DMG69_05845 [Acidobacteria bacterium]|nr:MAG: hypothetical protein DMG69_05845 [Acidobacteriota bacterium]
MWPWKGTNQTTTSIYSSKYHCVWTPKYRRAVLVGPIAKRCEQVLRQVAKNIVSKSWLWKSCPTTYTCW